MKSNDSIILSKSKDFALSVVDLYKYLIYNKKEFVISKQLLRCGTSIGANAKSLRLHNQKLILSQNCSYH